MSAIMRGATTARQHVNAFLTDALPPIIDLLRDETGLDEFQLPYPLEYDAYDPLTIDKYPTVGSLVSRTRDWQRIDITDRAEEVYEANYSMRVFIWVRTPSTPDGGWETPEYDSALRVRDDLLAVMRTCILTTPSLGSEGVCRVNEGSLSEDYLDAIKSGDQTPRWMVGGTLNFDMQMKETNHVVPYGQAETINVDEDLLIP